MEPLAAFASCVAVPSLAIQLLDSIHQIEQFLNYLSNVSKEVRRLLDTLEALELILHRIHVSVERQRKNHPGGDVDISQSITKAMCRCEDPLGRLKSILETAEKSMNDKHRPTRTLSKFKLAYRRRELAELEAQLHDAVSILTLAMTANLT